MSDTKIGFHQLFHRLLASHGHKLLNRDSQCPCQDAVQIRGKSHKNPGSSVLPEAGSGLPKAGSGLVEASRGLPEAGSGLPRADSGLPEARSGIPDASSGLPQAGSGLPQLGSGLPEACSGNLDISRFFFCIRRHVLATTTRRVADERLGGITFALRRL